MPCNMLGYSFGSTSSSYCCSVALCCAASAVFTSAVSLRRHRNCRRHRRVIPSNCLIHGGRHLKLKPKTLCWANRFQQHNVLATAPSLTHTLSTKTLSLSNMRNMLHSAPAQVQRHVAEESEMRARRNGFTTRKALVVN